MSGLCFPIRIYLLAEGNYGFKSFLCLYACMCVCVGVCVCVCVGEGAPSPPLSPSSFQCISPIDSAGSKAAAGFKLRLHMDPGRQALHGAGRAGRGPGTEPDTSVVIGAVCTAQKHNLLCELLF